MVSVEGLLESIRTVSSRGASRGAVNSKNIHYGQRYSICALYLELYLVVVVVVVVLMLLFLLLLFMIIGFNIMKKFLVGVM